jgi:hypothetical protein
MRTWAACGAVTILISSAVLTISGCDTPKTFSPDVQLTIGIPLMKETIEIGEEIEKADSIRVVDVDEEKEFQLHFSEEEIDLADDGAVGEDRLDVPAQTPEPVSSKVGLIKIDDVPAETTDPTLLTEVVPALGDLEGVPPAMWPPSLSVPVTRGKTIVQQVEYENFSYVRFSETSSPTVNRIRVSIANRGSIDLGPVMVYLSSTGDTTLAGEVLDLIVAPIEFTDVDAGDSIAAPDVDLVGVTIHTPLFVLTKVTTKATTLSPIPDDILQGYVSVTTDITALEVEEARAKIPEQSFPLDTTVSFQSQDLDLKRVVLTEMPGVPALNELTLVLTNQLPVAAKVRYNLADFAIPKQPLEGASLLAVSDSDYSSADIDIGSRQTARIVFDLDGATLARDDGGVLDRLRISVGTTILDSGDDFVVINKDDSVRVDTDVSLLGIQTVEGSIPADRPIEIALDAFSLEVEEDKIPAGLDGLKVVKAAISTRINTFGTTASIDADLRLGVLEDGAADSTIYHWLFSREIAGNTVLDLSVDQDDLYTSGGVTIGPLDIVNGIISNVFKSGSGAIDVCGTVKITGDIKLERGESRFELPFVNMDAPLGFDIPPGLTFDGKSATDGAFEIDLGDDAKEDFIPRVKTGQIFAEVESYFPIGGTLVMYASSDSTFSRLRSAYPAANRDLVTSIPTAMPSTAAIGNEAASVAEKAVFELFRIELPVAGRTADGSVDPTKPGVTTDPIVVTLNDEIQLFGYGEMYILPRIQLSSSSSGVAKLSPSDHLNLTIMMFAEATTKKNEEGE